MMELAQALDALAREHAAWVRLHYVYPYPHVDDVVALMTRTPSQGGLLPYLDIPFQHASPRILKLMKRPAAPEKVLDRLAMWRREQPEIAVRSTFIVGFPGETEAEFDELLAFLEEAQLDRVGCFAYSPVDGAAANALADPVPEPVKEDRRARFMTLQAAISADKLARKVGRTLDVLVDGHDEDRRTALARSAADAPEIDGVVRVDDAATLRPGAFARVTVTRASEHDLFARAA
jgi:ribosomal protein S12 methylthiotransferase